MPIRLNRRQIEQLADILEGSAPEPVQSPRVRRRRRLAVPEREIARNGVRELEARGIWTMRANSGRVRIKDERGERVFRAAPKGTADRVGNLPGSGRFLGIEWKAPGKRPTEHQVSWMLARNAEGGFAFWVDNMKTLAFVLDWVAANPRGLVVMDDRGDYDLCAES